MKIGILTFHRAWNYGAVLQCYALQQTLRGMGHSTYVIDYRQPDIENCYENNHRSFPWKGTLKAFIAPKRCKKQGFFYWYNIRRNFRHYRDTYFSLTASCTQSDIPTDFDAYIIGSDQLWVPDWIGGHFDDVYFGDFQRRFNSRVIGYAISSNERSISKLTSEALNLIKKNFDYLSFREDEIARMMGLKLQKNVSLVLDPTLLMKKESWSPLIKNASHINKPYMVTYHLPGRYGALGRDSFMLGAKKIAQKNHLRLIDLSDFDYSIPDFVFLIANASLVLTSSFHATVFSLIFNRPLMALQLNDGYDRRYVGLLNAIGASEAVYGLNYANTVIRPIDYAVVNENLDSLRKPSLDFLREALSM